MGLDSLLSPAEWLDEQILTQYTRISNKLNLDQEGRRYTAGLVLWLNYFWFCHTTYRQLFSAVSNSELVINIEEIGRIFVDVPDLLYNWWGLFGVVDNTATSGARVINRGVHFVQRVDATVRLPLFIVGTGFVGKFVTDTIGHLLYEVPMDDTSYNCLKYGVGLLSLASSMYIKETDPKLLDKEPFWKRVYSWFRERAVSPQPQPQRLPIKQQIDDTL